MAFATELSRTQSGLNGWIAARLADLRTRLERRRVFRTTLNELAVLSDRELADLGLHRSEIRRIAWQAAYEG